MVYTRAAFALALLLAGCPDNENQGSETEASSGGQSTLPTSAGSEGPCPMGDPCGNECVFLGSDENNCGACGNTCARGQVCSAGVCSAVCARPLASCGTECIDTTSDPDHCGGCDMACSNGRCVDGSCVACRLGRTECDNVCVNTATDTQNCGRCGNVCRLGQSCVAGTCTLVRM